MEMQRFQDNVVIVTGASSGIGKALALRLAGDSALLALAARNAERLAALAAECCRLGGDAVAVPTDVSDEVACRNLIEQTVERYGRIDALINNAGFTQSAALADLPDLMVFKQVLAVNLLGVVHCTYHALPHLRATGGRIVNIASLGGKVAVPGNTSYSASKFGVVGFSDALRVELVSAGVSVTVVCPYWVVTEFHERFVDAQGRPFGARGRAIYTDKMMTAERCAQITLDAAWRRQREVVMWPGALAAWLKLLAPGLLDRIVLRTFLRPAIRRVVQARTDS
jgi:short-subunit dehydrogenase